MGSVQTWLGESFTILLIAAAATVLSGCGAQNFPELQEFPAPQEFTDRTQLSTCGQAEPRFGTELRDIFSQAVVDCLSDARHKSGAEFVLTTFTDEGDPIVRYVRVAADSSDVELWVDRSQDKFGGGGTRWVHTTCPAPELSGESLTRCMMH